MATSSKTSNFSNYLPEGLIFYILSWTKGTSLVRFKSVCKLWHSIISDDKFIEFHHTNSLKNPSILMITYNMDTKEPPHAATIVSNFFKDSVDLRLPSSFYGMKLVNSCNGIVCVHDISGDDIYLWNPLTRMSKRLPIINIHEQPSPFGYNPRVVIGFACVSGDYKVLKITYEGDRYPLYMHLHKVYLYSSNANSWREIDMVNIRLPKTVNYTLESSLVVDGVVYFRGLRKIVTFDFHNEIFGLIPYPNSMRLKGIHKLGVLDFEGSIAVISEFGESVQTEFSVWTMELVSGMVLWKKTLTFDASLKVDSVVFHSGVKQFIGRTPSEEEIVCYDYKKKETKYFKLPESQSLEGLLNHTESFLSIKGFEHAEVK